MVWVLITVWQHTVWKWVAWDETGVKQIPSHLEALIRSVAFVPHLLMEMQ